MYQSATGVLTVFLRSNYVDGGQLDNTQPLPASLAVRVCSVLIGSLLLLLCPAGASVR
jgi:hypothetical protein